MSRSKSTYWILGRVHDRLLAATAYIAKSARDVAMNGRQPSGQGAKAPLQK